MKIVAPAIKNHFDNQLDRIGAGLKDGSLTAREAGKLLAQQKEMAQDLFEAKTDNGFIGPRERATIRQEQRETSRDIFQLRHDGQTR